MTIKHKLLDVETNIQAPVLLGLKHGEGSVNIDRIGPYYNKKADRVLKWVASKPGVIKDSLAQLILEQQGLTFNDVIDNRSVSDPQQLFDALARYGSRTTFRPNELILQHATSLAHKAFKLPQKLKSLDLQNVAEALQMNKSSGAPEYTSKEESFSKDLKRAVKIMRGRRAPDPCTSYRRVQFGSEDSGPKTRLVWAYPCSMTIIEALFARPLIDGYLKHKTTPMMFGFMKAGVGAKLVGITNCSVSAGLDFSKFDSSIHPKLIALAFSIIRAQFDEDESMETVWRVIEQYFIHTPIVMPDGIMYKKHKGVPSGSYFTQIIDSIVNYIIIQYTAISINSAPLAKGRVYVLGDDVAIGLDGEFDMQRWVKVLGSLGFTVNAGKSSVGHGQIDFLGQTWRGGIPHRPLSEVIKRGIYSESVSGIKDPNERRDIRLVSLLTDSTEANRLIDLVYGREGLDPRRSHLDDVQFDNHVSGWVSQLPADVLNNIPHYSWLKS
jgi:hypothetical protein